MVNTPKSEEEEEEEEEGVTWMFEKEAYCEKARAEIK